jgi:outer membrane lipoprotein carrier protein
MIVAAIPFMLALTAPALAETPAAEAPPAPAAEAGSAEAIDKLIDRVEAKYTDVELLRASFTQVSKSQLYGEETQAGKVTLQRPAKMRWEFTGDGKQFVTDGSTMWIFNPSDKQVIRYQDFGAQASAADSVLQSLDKIGELFTVELLAPDAGATHVLSLTPRNEAEQQSVKRLVLALDDELVLKRVEITDPFDSQTHLSFEDVQLGGTVPATTFQFDVPAGVEVIDAGG